MNIKNSNLRSAGFLASALGLVLGMGNSQALGQNHLVDGLTGPTFNLIAAPGSLSTPEGNSLYFWGYGNGNDPAPEKRAAQYSGPTLIVNQGQTVTIFLTNQLPVPTSIIFPGQSGVTAARPSAAFPALINGLLTSEARAANLSGTGGGVVRYQFVASQPGTYTYHSGTRPDLQVEMGLVGALIVRPSGFSPSVPASRKAYSDPVAAGSARADSEFDHEYLFLLSDMDEVIHNTVEQQVLSATSVPATPNWPVVDMSKRFSVYWFINGRCGPDTMLPAGHASLPIQPYDCFPLFHPGERVLMRVIGGGSDSHPFHHHGNHARLIAQDGRLLKTSAGASADLGSLEFTVHSTPGGTIDTMFAWTGQGLGWDAYGHTGSEALAPGEDPADHLKPFPVTLPAEQHIVNGMMYGGSPFLGSPGILPPGEGGFNPNNGFMFLWHSHAEKEIVNNNIFPGGMLTMALVEAWPPGTPVALGTTAPTRTAPAAATTSPTASVAPQPTSAKPASSKTPTASTRANNAAVVD